MNIQTVKIQAEGFLLNGVMSVPNDSGNRHYVEIQEWIVAGNTPDPEFTNNELLSNAKKVKLEELSSDSSDASVQDVLVLGSLYPADKDYQLIVLTLASRSSRGRPTPATLRGVDGIPVNVTPVLLDALEDAIFNQVATSLDTLAIKQGLVAVAVSVAEVEAITFAG